MFNRAQLKEKGKERMKRNYWPSVAAAFVLSMAGGSALSSGGNVQYQISNNQQQATEVVNQMSRQEVIAIATVALSLIAISVVLVSALTILLFNPLNIGGRRFFLKNSTEDNVRLNELSYGFQNNYSNIVIVMLVRGVLIALWSLLLIIPGVIKRYSYQLVPYLLAENPDMPYKEALETSAAMMDGYKMEAFKLDLSFIGWDLLSVFTCGLLHFLFVSPYEKATDAELYRYIKEHQA